MNDVQRGFDFLRVSLETHLEGPAIVTVVSARADDGTSVVAAGLAESFADAGRQTLLVSTGAAAFGAQRQAGSAGGSLLRSTADQLTANVPGGRAAFAAGVGAFRERYGVVVIDGEALPGSALAYELARAADGVLVSVRLGRRPCAEDRATMKLLEDARANVLGVVPTNVRAGVSFAGDATSIGAHGDGLRRLATPLEATRSR